MLNALFRWCRPLSLTESVSKCTESLNLTVRTGQCPTHQQINNNQSTSTRQHICILKTTLQIYLAISLLVRYCNSTLEECDDEEYEVLCT